MKEWLFRLSLPVPVVDRLERDCELVIGIDCTEITKETKGFRNTDIHGAFPGMTLVGIFMGF